MVHISFGIISQSDDTTGTTLLAFWCYAGMRNFLAGQSSLEAKHIMVTGVVSPLSTPV